MKMMSVKTHKIVWDDNSSYSLEISTHPDNPEYVILTWENYNSVISQMTIPLQVAKSFHMVLRDF